jgi:putative restriction endonuclease
MPTQFLKGAEYTRATVADQIGLPAGKRLGNWNTGYAEWNGEVFVFCNVGTAGRTGHDYPNRWEGPELVWYGKGPARAHQRLIKRMTGGEMPVHIFWRDNDRGSFIYAGRGRAVDVVDSSPVGVRWRFN